MERTLIFGILLFMSLFILNLKLSQVSSKGLGFKLGIFFLIMTLLFLMVSGIIYEFNKIPIITSLLAIICFCLELIKSIIKIFNKKVDVMLVFCLIIAFVCELYNRIDPYGYFLYTVFNQVINVNKIKIFAIIGFIVFLSVKVFSGIFFKKDLQFINREHFKVKDGKK